MSGEMHQLHQELQEVTAKLRSSEAQVESLKLELAALKEVVENRAAQKWTPHCNERFSSNLADYKDHPLYRDAFRYAKLDIYLSLDEKERSKLSISAFVYVRLNGNVNTEQLCTISKSEIPPDPATVIYTHRRHLRDIDSNFPLFAEAMVSIPEDSPQHVKKQVSSGYRVGTQICFEGESMEKKKNRLQFNVKESDKILIVLAALDRSLSKSVLKKQVRYLRSSGLLTSATITRMPTILEGGEDDGGNGTQDCGSDLPLNGLVLVDDERDDDVSTITDRGSMIPTEIHRENLIAHLIDEAVSNVGGGEKAEVEQILKSSMETLPNGALTEQAAHISNALLEANLPEDDAICIASDIIGHLSEYDDGDGDGMGTSTVVMFE